MNKEGRVPVRRLVTLTAVLLAVVVVPAAAKPRLLCKQVKDPTGDAPSMLPGGGNVDALDIVSADVATGKKNLVAAMRLKSLAENPSITFGASYRLSWVSGTAEQQLYYRLDVDGTRHGSFQPTAGGPATSEIPVTATADMKSATITWVLPRGKVAGSAKRGFVLTDIQLVTYSAVNKTPVHEESVSDTGGIGAPEYVDGTPTCLKGV